MFMANILAMEATARARIEATDLSWMTNIYSEAASDFDSQIQSEEARERRGLAASLASESSSLALSAITSTETAKRRQIDLLQNQEMSVLAVSLETALRAAFTAQAEYTVVLLLQEMEADHRRILTANHQKEFLNITSSAWASFISDQTEKIVAAEKAARAQLSLAAAAASRLTLEEGEALLREAVGAEELMAYERLQDLGRDMVHAGQRVKLEQEYMSSLRDGLWRLNCANRMEICEDAERHERWSSIFQAEELQRTVYLVEFEAAIRSALQSREHFVYARAFADFVDDSATLLRDAIQAQEKRTRLATRREANLAIAQLLEELEVLLRAEMVAEEALFAANLMARFINDGSAKKRRNIERQELVRRERDVKLPWVSQTLQLWVDWEEKCRDMLLEEFLHGGIDIIEEGETGYRQALEKYEAQRWAYLIERYLDRVKTSREDVLMTEHVAGRNAVWAEQFDDLAWLVEMQEEERRVFIASAAFIGVFDILELRDEEILSTLVADALSSEAERRRVIVSSWASYYLDVIHPSREDAKRQILLSDEKRDRLRRCFEFEEQQRALLIRFEQRELDKIVALRDRRVIMEEQMTIIDNEKRLRAAILAEANEALEEFIAYQQEEAMDRLLRAEVRERHAIHGLFQANKTDILVTSVQLEERKMRRLLAIERASTELIQYTSFADSFRRLLGAEWVATLLTSCVMGESSRRAAIAADEMRARNKETKIFRRDAFETGFERVQHDETQSRWETIVLPDLFEFAINQLTVDHEALIRDHFEQTEDAERMLIEEQIFASHQRAITGKLESSEISERQRIVAKAHHAVGHMFLQYASARASLTAHEEQRARFALLDRLMVIAYTSTIVDAEAREREQLLLRVTRGAGPLVRAALASREATARQIICVSHAASFLRHFEDFDEEWRDVIEREESRLRRLHFGPLQLRDIRDGLLGCIEAEERRERGGLVLQRRVIMAQVVEREESAARAATVERDNVLERLYFTEALYDDLRRCADDEERVARTAIRRGFTTIAASSLLSLLQERELDERAGLWDQFVSKYVIEVRLQETWGKAKIYSSYLYVGEFFKWEMESHLNAIRAEERRCVADLRAELAVVANKLGFERALHGEAAGRGTLIRKELTARARFVNQLYDASAEDFIASVDMERRIRFSEAAFSVIDAAIIVDEAQRRVALMARGGSKIQRFLALRLEQDFRDGRRAIVDSMFFGFYNITALQGVSEPFERAAIEANWLANCEKFWQQLQGLESATKRYRVQKAELMARLRIRRDNGRFFASCIEDAAEPVVRALLIQSDFFEPLITKIIPRSEARIRAGIEFEERLAADRIFFAAMDLLADARFAKFDTLERRARIEIVASWLVRSLAIMETKAEGGHRSAIESTEASQRTYMFRRIIAPQLQQAQKSEAERVECIARIAVINDHVKAKLLVYEAREEEQRGLDIIASEQRERRFKISSVFESRLRRCVERDALDAGLALLRDEVGVRYALAKSDLEFFAEVNAREQLRSSAYTGLAVQLAAYEEGFRTDLVGREAMERKTIIHNVHSQGHTLMLAITAAKERSQRTTYWNSRSDYLARSYEAADEGWRRVVGKERVTLISTMLFAAEDRIRNALKTWDASVRADLAKDAAVAKKRVQRWEIEQAETRARSSVKSAHNGSLLQHLESCTSSGRFLLERDQLDEREAIFWWMLEDGTKLRKKELQIVETCNRQVVWNRQVTTRLADLLDPLETADRVSQVAYIETERRGKLYWNFWADRIRPSIVREEVIAWQRILQRSLDDEFRMEVLRLQLRETAARTALASSHWDQSIEIADFAELGLRDALLSCEESAYKAVTQLEGQRRSQLMVAELSYTERIIRNEIVNQRVSEILIMYSTPYLEDSIIFQLSSPEFLARVGLLFDVTHVLGRGPGSPTASSPTTTRLRSTPLEVHLRQAIQRGEAKEFVTLIQQCLSVAVDIQDRNIRRRERAGRAELGDKWVAEALETIVPRSEYLHRLALLHSEDVDRRAAFKAYNESALALAVGQLEHAELLVRGQANRQQRLMRRQIIESADPSWRRVMALDESQARRQILVTAEGRGRAAFIAQWWNYLAVVAPPFMTDLHKLKLQNLETSEKTIRRSRIIALEAIARARALDDHRQNVLYVPMRRQEHTEFITIASREERQRFTLLFSVIASTETTRRKQLHEIFLRERQAALERLESAARYCGIVAPFVFDILPPMLVRHEGNIRSTAKIEFQASRAAVFQQFGEVRFQAMSTQLVIAERLSRESLARTALTSATTTMQAMEQQLRSALVDFEDAEITAQFGTWMNKMASAGIHLLPTEHARGVRRIHQQATASALRIMERMEEGARHVLEVELNVFAHLASSPKQLTLRNRYVLWLQDMEHTIRNSLYRFEEDRGVVLAEAAASSYDLLSRIAVMDLERHERSRIFRLAVFGAQSPPIMFSIEVDRSLASFWLHLSCDEETAWRDSIMRDEQANRRATLNSMHRRLLEALVHTQEQHRRRSIFSERCSETLVVLQQFETTLRSSAIAQLHSQRLMQYEHGVALALGDHQRTRHNLFVRRLYFSHHLESWARVLAEAQRFEHSARSELVRRMQIEYCEISSTFMFACQDIAAGVSLGAFHQLFAEEQRQRVKVTLGDTHLREARVRRDIHQQQFNDRLLLLSRRAEDSHHLGIARGFAIGLTTAYERFATEASTLSWVRHVRERALKLQDFAQDSLVKLRDSLEQSEAHSRRAIHSNRFESLRHDFELHAEPTFRQYWIDKEAQQQLQLTRLAASLAAKHEFSTLQFVEHSARNAIWNARLREVLHIYSGDYHALSVAVCVQLPHVRVLSGITQLVEATRRRELLQFATRTTARIHASANAEFEILASAQIRSNERQQRLVLRAEYFALYCAALEGFEERLRRDVLDAEEEATIELTRVHAVTDGGHACSEISQLEADVRHGFNLERTKFVLETFARHESEVRHCVQAVFLKRSASPVYTCRYAHVATGCGDGSFEVSGGIRILPPRR
jgi:hypothetical protein